MLLDGYQACQDGD